MQERIREIAEQAEQYVKSNPQAGVTIHAGDMFNKKFAELLVGECAEVADNADATREKWQSIGKFVKDHFGVT